MDRLQFYRVLYSEYVEQLRPLISKIEVLEERDPEEMFSIVAFMFDSFAQTINANKLDDENWGLDHLNEALLFRNRALIVCYRILIRVINDRASKCQRGLSNRQIKELPSGFVSDLVEAKKKARLTKQYYRDYVQLTNKVKKMLSNTEKEEAKAAKAQLFEVSNHLVKSYQEAYSEYIKVEEYLKKDRQLEIKMLALRRERRIKNWTDFYLPVILTVIFTIIGYLISYWI